MDKWNSVDNYFRGDVSRAVFIDSPQELKCQQLSRSGSRGGGYLFRSIGFLCSRDGIMNKGKWFRINPGARELTEAYLLEEEARRLAVA